MFGTAGLMMGGLGAHIPGGSAGNYALAVTTGEAIALSDPSTPSAPTALNTGRTLVCARVVRVAGVSLGYDCATRVDRLSLSSLR